MENVVSQIDALEAAKHSVEPRRDGYYVCNELINPGTIQIGAIAFRGDSNVACSRPLVSEQFNELSERTSGGKHTAITRHTAFTKALPILQKATKTPDIWKDGKSDVAYAAWVTKVMFRGKYALSQLLHPFYKRCRRRKKKINLLVARYVLDQGMLKLRVQGDRNGELIYFGLIHEGSLFISEADEQKARFYEFEFVQSDVFDIK